VNSQPFARLFPASSDLSCEINGWFIVQFIVATYYGTIFFRLYSRYLHTVSKVQESGAYEISSYRYVSLSSMGCMKVQIKALQILRENVKVPTPIHSPFVIICYDTLIIFSFN
jgi:hypothetical protein